MTFFFSQAKPRSEDGRVFFRLFSKPKKSPFCVRTFGNQSNHKRTVERKKEKDQRGLMNDD
jgi:hypothetical protein